MGQEPWAIGVDLGGTKVEVAVVDASGNILQRLKQPTQVETGPDRIMADIAKMVRQLQDQGPQTPPAGVGVGVAGQVTAATGVVRFAPNLKWREVPLQDRLQTGPDVAGGGHQRRQGRDLGRMAPRRRPGSPGPHLPVYRHRHRRRGGERRPDARRLHQHRRGTGAHHHRYQRPPLHLRPPGLPRGPGRRLGHRPPGPGGHPGGPRRRPGLPSTPRGSKNRWRPKTSTPRWWPPRPRPTTPWPG